MIALLTQDVHMPVWGMIGWVLVTGLSIVIVIRWGLARLALVRIIEDTPPTMELLDYRHGLIDAALTVASPKEGIAHIRAFMRGNKLMPYS